LSYPRIFFFGILQCPVSVSCSTPVSMFVLHRLCDYAGDLNKRRLTTGYVFTFSQTLMSWCCTSQAIVALSMIEADYIALTEAVKEVIWLQGLMDDLGIEQDFLKVNFDSMSAIHPARNKSTTRR